MRRVDRAIETLLNSLRSPPARSGSFRASRLFQAAAPLLEPKPSLTFSLVDVRKQSITNIGVILEMLGTMRVSRQAGAKSLSAFRRDRGFGIEPSDRSSRRRCGERRRRTGHRCPPRAIAPLGRRLSGALNATVLNWDWRHQGFGKREEGAKSKSESRRRIYL